MNRAPDGRLVPGEPQPDGRLVPGEPQPGDHRHPYELLVPPGEEEPVQVDVALVPLVRALWAAGFEMVTCCQDIGESIGGLNARRGAYWKGWVLLELRSRPARRLAELAATAGGFPMHWTDEAAWEMSIPVAMLGGIRPVIPDLVQVRFPASQVRDLTALVETERRQT
jgi:hypothetical protein